MPTARTTTSLTRLTLVAVIAVLGAVALLGETLGARLVVSGAMVLGGLAMVLSRRAPARG